MTESPERLQNWWALFAAAVAAAAGVGIAVGAAIGLTVGASTASDCSPTDGWCELGAVLVGLAFGVVIGIIGYITTAVIMVVRFRPAGRRAGHIGAILATPPAAILALAILGALADIIR